MKDYNTAFIKQYIKEHKDEIESVDCGMREDWFWTACTVYEDGQFSDDYDWGSKSIRVAGICGSVWATPVMSVHLKNGDDRIVECFLSDGNSAAASEIARMKAFAAATGGMDYKQ